MFASGLKVAIIHENPDYKDLLSFLTQSQYNAGVSCYRNSFDFETAQEHFDVTITDLPDRMGYNPLQMRKLFQLHPHTQFLFLSENVQEDSRILQKDKTFFLEKPFLAHDFLGHLSKNIKPEYRQSAKYFPVSVDLLMRVKNIQAPLYLKIGDSKYIKVAHKNTLFEQEAHDRYVSKGVSEFYLPENLSHDFIQPYVKEVFANDAWVRADSLIESISVNVDVLRQFSQKVGWGPELVEFAKKSTAKALALAKRTKSFQKVFQSFQKIEKFGFADCSILLVMTSANLAKLTHQDTPRTLHRLSFASLFHDITLNDFQYDKQNKLVEQVRGSNKNLSEDMQEFFHHPLMASELIRSWGFAPEGCEAIIADHHELPNGTGFPKGKTADVLEMESALFIVALDIVHFYISHLGEIDLKQYVQLRKAVFKGSHFSKIFSSLERI